MYNLGVLFFDKFKHFKNIVCSLFWGWGPFSNIYIKDPIPKTKTTQSFKNVEICQKSMPA